MIFEAKPFKEIITKDNNDHEITLLLFVDPLANAVFAVDASYVDQLSNEIQSPYNKEVVLKYSLEIDGGG